MKPKNKSESTKGQLHPRNPHRGRYDIAALVKHCPMLSEWLRVNPRGEQSIDFSSDQAVRLLNQALLAQHYHIAHWNIPSGYLCPPIPGRADYIHYAADLLAEHDKKPRVLDIGTGANCIYPILGVCSYQWRVVASDIDPVSVRSAQLIVDSNRVLKGKIAVRLQSDSNAFFSNVIAVGEYFDLTLCNPPFHASQAQADAATTRKQQNLTPTKTSDPVAAGRNFGGQQSELWCRGGEIHFLKEMCKESVRFASQVGWFSSLVSKRENISPLRQLLTKLGVKEIKVIDMAQGQKVSRMLAWRFH